MRTEPTLQLVGTELVATTLLTTAPDPQRGVQWEPDGKQVAELARSLAQDNRTLTVLYDDEPYNTDDPALETVLWMQAEPGGNPYQWRWFVYLNYLARLDIVPEFVWLVDATDVVRLRTPQPAHHALYVGSEPHTLASEWLRDNHGNHRTRHFLDNCDPTAPLYNPGIVGGDYFTVLAFLGDMASCYPRPGDLTDMGMFNDIIHTHWHDKIITGERVHTTFKAYADNGYAWWQHK